jgi:hypothetical protein
LLRPADAPPAPEARPLPPLKTRSGRTIRLVDDGRGEQLSVTSPDGRVELTVRFDADGPVLSFSGARLALSAPRDIALACDRFTVQAASGVEITSPEDVTVRSDASVRVDGATLLLNCAPPPPASRRG